MKKLYILFFTLLISAVSFGQVFITELADPNDNPNARYIELYNAGSTTVDLSTWRIDKYTNASATVSQTLTLTGTIAAGGFYIIATGPMDTVVFDTWGVTPDQWDTGSNNVAGSNGDDNLELYDGSNALIDQFGVPGEDGSLTLHEFEDGRAERKASVTTGNPTWDASEWNIDNDSGGGAGPINTNGFDPGAWIGTASGPTITLGSPVTGLDYFEGFGPSAEGSFSVEGINLTEGILVSAPSTDFELSLTSGGTFTPTVIVTQNAGTASDVVFVRLASGLIPNAYSGDVTATSAGATEKTVGLSGTVTAADPQITVTAFLGSFNYIDTVGGPSPEDTFTVEGLFLTSDIVVTAPTSFEVSLTTSTGFASSVNVPFGSGTVATTTIFLRLASGLAVGPYSGNITVSSTAVTDELVAVSGNVFGPPTNSLIISGVFDAQNGSSPKGVELYVKKNIADLSLYGIGSANNGGGTDGQEFTFPAVAATQGQYIYIIGTGQTAKFGTFFGFPPDYEAGAMSINGDDAIELFENGTVIDTYGDINVDGTGQPWDSVDGWAYRVNDTGPDGSTFVLANWTFSGTLQLDGATNATSTVPFPSATFSNTLSINDFEANNFKLYPNPTSKGFVNISSNNSSAMKVTVFDVLGKQVINQIVSNKRLDVSNLNTGVYIMRVTQDNASSTKKLVIK